MLAGYHSALFIRLCLQPGCHGSIKNSRYPFPPGSSTLSLLFPSYSDAHTLLFHSERCQLKETQRSCHSSTHPSEQSEQTWVQQPGHGGEQP